MSSPHKDHIHPSEGDMYFAPFETPPPQTPVDSEGWSIVGWALKDMTVAVDYEADQFEFGGVSMNMISGKKITASLNVEESSGWVVDSITQEHSHALACTIYEISLLNLFTGQKWFSNCSVSDYMLTDLKDQSDLEELIHRSFMSLMSPQQIQTYKIFVNQKDGSSWHEGIVKGKAFGLTKHFKGSDEPKLSDNPSRLANLLPGIEESVKHPVTMKNEQLKYVIMDLNDNYKWSRDKIADWIESLDIDTRFKVDTDEDD